MAFEDHPRSSPCHLEKSGFTPHRHATYNHGLLKKSGGPAENVMAVCERRLLGIVPSLRPLLLLLIPSVI
ncbi:MAG: hypothetical protein ABIS50_17345 [Luteolibacter sp.]|uniref:hypothetical protein n=1 Tax=Luteolibacter sp. TaxID=1962973 RepID=UPI0032646621